MMYMALIFPKSTVFDHKIYSLQVGVCMMVPVFRAWYFNSVDLTANMMLYSGSLQTISYPCPQHLWGCQAFGADTACCQPHGMVYLPTSLPYRPAYQPYITYFFILDPAFCYLGT